MAKKKRERQNQAVLPILKPNAAGIDIGATEIWVAVPADRDRNPYAASPPSPKICTA